jgi:C4-dicarboxylate-specific signal transduction histidine kinase
MQMVKKRNYKLVQPPSYCLLRIWLPRRRLRDRLQHQVKVRKQLQHLTPRKLEFKLQQRQDKLFKAQLRLQQQTNKRKQSLHKLLQRLMQPKPLPKLLLHKVQPRLQQQILKCKQLQYKPA